MYVCLFHQILCIATSLDITCMKASRVGSKYLSSFCSTEMKVGVMSTACTSLKPASSRTFPYAFTVRRSYPAKGRMGFIVFLFSLSLSVYAYMHSYTHTSVPLFFFLSHSLFDHYLSLTPLSLSCMHPITSAFDVIKELL